MTKGLSKGLGVRDKLNVPIYPFDNKIMISEFYSCTTNSDWNFCLHVLKTDRMDVWRSSSQSRWALRFPACSQRVRGSRTPFPGSAWWLCSLSWCRWGWWSPSLHCWHHTCPQCSWWCCYLHPPEESSRGGCRRRCPAQWSPEDLRVGQGGLGEGGERGGVLLRVYIR